MVSALGSPWINRGRALRTIECVKEKRGQPCACVCGSILLYAFEHTCSLHACPCPCVCACVSVCEDHYCDGGKGSLRFKPWNWLTGAFPLWSAGYVCAAWNKDLALGEYPGDRHLHKTASHTTSSSLCLAHTSISQMYLLKLHVLMHTLITTHHPHQQSTASTQYKPTAQGGDREINTLWIWRTDADHQVFANK